MNPVYVMVTGQGQGRGFWDTEMLFFGLGNGY